MVISVGMLIGWLVYGLAPAGNIGNIYLAAILFSLVMSGLGVSIANQSATILQSIFVMFAFIMIFQLMGGLFTPISSMPQWAQYITYAVPPRYFIEIMRAVYLKGSRHSRPLAAISLADSIRPASMLCGSPHLPQAGIIHAGSQKKSVLRRMPENRFLLCC